ncbi:Mitogen-activated protein kinase kinase kinase kinase 4 [Fukomys damarensis]|uniref:Mitogen-activated protein kinase kinase kinase kinase 4 n=1 Tax=Fukomys damarensis TaxID=885580 RepID=A0A091D6T6_FUKDA|nr:Mitogen-activated protein kinase kinase kinase kinase 4 [Fukomys damarensis]
MSLELKIWMELPWGRSPGICGWDHLCILDPAGIFELVEVVGNGTYGQVYKVGVGSSFVPVARGNFVLGTLGDGATRASALGEDSPCSLCSASRGETRPGLRRPHFLAVR